MNLKYNGNKVTLIVGATATYTHTITRTRDITPRQLLMAFALIPGEGACKRIFSPGECLFWTENRYASGLEMIPQLKQQGIPDEEIQPTLLKMSKEIIFKKPFQYALLNAMEGVKMLFWESTRIGYVSYPGWLERIFDNSILKDGLRFTISLLTIVGLFFSTRLLIIQHKKIFLNLPENFATLVLLNILIIIFSNIILYSFSMTNTRYALPIAPLYLLCIALWLEKWAQN